MNKNNLQPNQPSYLAALSPAASPETNHSPLTTHHSPKRKSAFTLAEGATHVAHWKDFRKVAFTLAEVLITLGIIGVVAALTLPSVINNYKSKQLEVAFKKTNSAVTSALNDTLFEFGLKEFSFKELCGGYSNSLSCYQANSGYFEQINNYFLSRFNVVKIITDTMYNQLNRETILVTNFIGNKKTFGYGQQYGMNAGNTPWHSVNFLSDGSVVSALTFFYHGASDGVALTFDTNGPYRGPNRWGYDIFIITTGTWYKPCSKLVPGLENGNYNGRGCYEYALKNINPDDKTKEYWKSLYE